jgi:ribosomal protein S18 acetylase RimI-like enzyme
VSVAVRRATVEDAEAIGAVHVASWRVAYRDAAPEGWLAAQSEAERAGSWRRRLVGAGSESAFVAVTNGAVIGFSGLAMPGHDEDAGPHTAEIPTFYVHPDSFRMGAGQALMDASLENFVAHGFTTVTLWVLEGNARARAFYATCGFTADGARKAGDDWPDQIRLRRAIQ